MTSYKILFAVSVVLVLSGSRAIAITGRNPYQYLDAGKNRHFSYIRTLDTLNSLETSHPREVSDFIISVTIEKQRRPGMRRVYIFPDPCAVKILQ